MSSETLPPYVPPSSLRSEALRSSRRQVESLEAPDRFLALWFGSYVFQAFAIVAVVAIAVLAFLLPVNLVGRLAFLVVAAFSGVLIYSISELIQLLMSIERSLRITAGRED